MEERNIEILVRTVEDLKKQVQQLSKKIEDREKKEKAYQSEEYHQKIERFLKETFKWSLREQKFLLDAKSRSLITYWPTFLTYNVRVDELPEPDGE